MNATSFRPQVHLAHPPPPLDNRSKVRYSSQSHRHSPVSPSVLLGGYLHSFFPFYLSCALLTAEDRGATCNYLFSRTVKHGVLSASNWPVIPIGLSLVYAGFACPMCPPMPSDDTCAAASKKGCIHISQAQGLCRQRLLTAFRYIRSRLENRDADFFHFANSLSPLQTSSYYRSERAQWGQATYDCR